MAFSDGFFSGDNGTAFILRLTYVETSVDTPNNQSTVAWSLDILKNDSAYFDFNNATNHTWSVTINGNVYNGNWGPYNFGSYSSLNLVASSTVIPHNSDGTKTITVSSSANGGFPIGSASNSGSLVLTNINVAAGKRWTGSAWTDTTINKRWTGSAWTDLTIKKRWSGSAWVDIS